MDLFSTDIAIVGGGLAGLRTAIAVKELNPSLQITIFNASDEDISSSYLAQGGVAAAVSSDDSPELHYRDTMKAGHGLSVATMVKILVHEIVDEIHYLQTFIKFDHDEKGQLQLGKEGAHSKRRVLHIGGDQTGKKLVEHLYKRALELEVEFKFYTPILKMFTRQNTITHLLAANLRKKDVFMVEPKAVVLATGGISSLYQYSTNPPLSIGSGNAMAWNAGAELVDLEFIQFHPTVFIESTTSNNSKPVVFLVSEAVRGEGARLLNNENDYFMEKYHDLKDLAPRDVVARSILKEVEEGCGINGRVLLDTTILGSRFRSRFPSIYAMCKNVGIDPEVEPIPVTPAAHYFMGGIAVDEWGKTTIQNLWAVGECASTGIHGSNRLASNSLAECLVFGRRAGSKIVEFLTHTTTKNYSKGSQGFPSDLEFSFDKHNTVITELKDKIRAIMWKYGGIVRNEALLRKGLSLLDEVSAAYHKQISADSTKKYVMQFQLEWMLTNAKLLLKAALTRKESRGAHYRTDFPQQNNEQWRVRIYWKKEEKNYMLRPL